jgi:anti-anti-sigma regulatory factor
MADNFRIFAHQNSESLHLKLMGELDQTSAFTVLDTIRKRGGSVDRIFIHTDGLTAVNPLGGKLLFTHLDSHQKRSPRIVFTGTRLSQAGSAA